MKSKKVLIKILIVTIICLILSLLAVNDISKKISKNIENANTATRNLFNAYIEDGMDRTEAAIKAQDIAQQENMGDWWSNDNTKEVFIWLVRINIVITIILVIIVGPEMLRILKEKRNSFSKYNLKKIVLNFLPIVIIMLILIGIAMIIANENNKNASKANADAGILYNNYIKQIQGQN